MSYHSISLHVGYNNSCPSFWGLSSTINQNLVIPSGNVCHGLVYTWQCKCIFTDFPMRVSVSLWLCDTNKHKQHWSVIHFRWQNSCWKAFNSYNENVVVYIRPLDVKIFKSFCFWAFVFSEWLCWGLESKVGSEIV